MAKKLTVEKVSKALIDNHGLVIHAARALGVHRSTLHEFIKKNPQVRNAMEEARLYLAEHAEIILRQHLQDGNLKASMFILRTIGGWSEKLMIGHGFAPETPEIPQSPEAQKLGIEYLRMCAKNK